MLSNTYIYLHLLALAIWQVCSAKISIQLRDSFLQKALAKNSLYPFVSFQIVGGCWDVMGGRALRWRWGSGGRRPPSCQGLNDSSGTQVRAKGRRVRFHRSASLVRVRPRERRRLWIARIWLRFRRRTTPEPCPDPGCQIVHLW